MKPLIKSQELSLSNLDSSLKDSKGGEKGKRLPTIKEIPKTTIPTKYSEEKSFRTTSTQLLGHLNNNSQLASINQLQTLSSKGKRTEENESKEKSQLQTLQSKEDTEENQVGDKKKSKQFRKSFLNRISTQAHRYSIEQRQQIQNFRMKRDIWIRDLQEVFNKIYENFVSTLETYKEEEGKKQTKEEKKMFCKKLKQQMREILKISKSLSDKGDEFIHLQDNMPITHYYKSNIMEMHKLLSILLKLQYETRHLDKIKTQKKYDNKCAEPLIEEIKRSQRRVQRLKAGNKLGKVIQDQLEIPEIAHHLNEKQKDNLTNGSLQSTKGFLAGASSVGSNRLQEGSTERGQPRKVLMKSLHESNEDENIKIIDDHHTHSDEHQDIEDYDCYENQFDGYSKSKEGDLLNLDDALLKFKNKKLELEQIVDKFIDSFNKTDFNFNEKYKNFKEYFQTRYQLMGMYFGEDKLGAFLDENQKTLLPKKNETPRGKEKDEFENLYKDLDPANYSVEEKNIEALQKIIKINEEIRRNLIEEEHAKKMQALDKMNVEQNQQFWTAVFEKKELSANAKQQQKNDSQNSKNSIDRQGSFSSSKLKNTDKKDSDAASSQRRINRESGSQGAVRETFKAFSKNEESSKHIKNQGDQLKLYHDYIHRNVNYDSHPSNPHLKPVVEERFRTDKIKFSQVTDSQSLNIVSSVTSIQKNLQERQRDLLAKQVKSNSQQQDEFRKTFQLNIALSQTQKNNFRPNDLLIKYPLGDRPLSSECIYPKQKEKLSYEEEMRQIEQQTKEETPLYLNKFNSRNYFSRIASVKKNINISQNITDASTVSKIINSSSASKIPPINNSIFLGIGNIPDAQQSIISPSKEKLKQFGAKEKTSKKNYFENVGFKESFHEGSIKPVRINAAREEIPSVFRQPQKDVLLKINGPQWKTVN